MAMKTSFGIGLAIKASQAAAAESLELINESRYQANGMVGLLAMVR